MYTWNDEPLVMRTFPWGSAQISPREVLIYAEAQEVPVPKVRTRAPLAADDRGESQPQVVRQSSHASTVIVPGTTRSKRRQCLRCAPFGHTHLIDGFIMFHIFVQCCILELECMMIPTDFHGLLR